MPPDTTTTKKAPAPFTPDPNSVADFAVSKGLVDKWTPESASKLFEQQGLGTAAQYLSYGKNNSAANLALFAKLKGYSGTSGSGISGSGSVTKGTQTSGATSSALSSITPDEVKNTTTEGIEQVNAELVDQTSSPTDVYKQGLDNAKMSYKTIADNQIQKLTDQFTPVYQAGLEQIKNVEAAARQEYKRAGGIVDSTGEQQYVANAVKPYKERLDQIQTTFNSQQMEIRDNLMLTEQQLEQKYNEQLSTFRSNQISSFKDYVGSIKMSDGTMPSASEIMDMVDVAIQGGKTYTQAVAEIRGALDYAKRVQDKADLSERNIMSQMAHRDLMDAKILSSLNEKKDEELTPSEVDQYQADYPKATIKMGMTKGDAAREIEKAPKYTLGKVFISSDWTKEGILESDREQIRQAFENGYTVDEVIQSIEGITPEQEILIRKNVKPVK